MSDQKQAFERWEAPFFESVGERLPESDPVEEAAKAQARGFNVGKWEGLESGLAEAEKIVSQMSALVEEMMKPFRDLDQMVIRELAGVVMLITRQIVRREMTIDSQVVTDIVEEAVKTLSSLEGDIEIALHPTNVAFVKKNAGDSLEGKSWRLVEDPSLIPGGCRVKTPRSLVDASVEKQMEMVFGMLLDASENNLDD